MALTLDMTGPAAILQSGGLVVHAQQREWMMDRQDDQAVKAELQTESEWVEE